jgi:hypothetical protein
MGYNARNDEIRDLGASAIQNGGSRLHSEKQKPPARHRGFLFREPIPSYTFLPIYLGNQDSARAR